MANKTNKFQDPKQFLTPVDEEHSRKNCKLPVDAIKLEKVWENRTRIIMLYKLEPEETFNLSSLPIN